MISLPSDYTLERARQVYCRDEFTRWLIQGRLSDPELPEFQINVTVARTGRKPRQRRLKNQSVHIIFLFGYEDHPWHWLGKVITEGGPNWWQDILREIHNFYVESKFYGNMEYSNA
ncbi:hypothetical protein LCGC14_0846780 [marine sediment metagenome]|uniref:Uncharacterized protein n=1 Tax=marine sediment metagenome TaxID=412755 RepID=A0A0F9PWR7_9ZZZZ